MAKKFPDLNKDGKLSKADILIGRGVLPKNKMGGSKPKYQRNGEYSRGIVGQTPKRSLTPMEKYIKKTGAPASDTLIKTGKSGTFPNDLYFRGYRAENPKNEKALQRAAKAKEKEENLRLSTLKKGGSAHPGFKAVQSSIAKKQGVSKQAAGAILAASTRKASAAAKRANPRLKKVK